MRRLPLRSPPRMRGKVIVRSRNAVQIGITPAYAGKSARILKRRTEKRDHPRVCGEKLKFGTNVTKNPGSPPRVRGKGGLSYSDVPLYGITPACAGTSTLPLALPARRCDHPRVCGEKQAAHSTWSAAPGSPPRVRGKGCGFSGFFDLLGITPACAGKSMYRTTETPWSRDHPRVCGEKRQQHYILWSLSGSPPRMRGKVLLRSGPDAWGRITPAYAGKRHVCSAPCKDTGDHPRVCGEKGSSCGAW